MSEREKRQSQQIIRLLERVAFLECQLRLRCDFCPLRKKESKAQKPQEDIYEGKV